MQQAARRVGIGIGGLSLALAGAICTGSTAAAQTVGTPPDPIVSLETSARTFIGHAAKRDPHRRGWRVPRHPKMAPNGRSNLHNDAYQTDTYARRGPLGRKIKINSTLFERNCGSLTFDGKGRIVTICIGFDGPILVLLHPRTLTTLATFELPPRQLVDDGDIFTNVSGGGYFYLDHRNRVVVPTTTRHIWIVKPVAGPGFAKVADYDLSGVVSAEAGILSALPDWKGRIWFAARDGTIGWVAPRNGSVHVRRLGEPIQNSFAVDRGGVFVVTDRALYRLEARGGKVRRIWRRAYPNSGVHKQGQFSAGSGTTPTLIGRDKVAITDNARRMHVIVYRRGRRSRGREVCRRGVFRRGRSATENSLVAFGNSIIVENNHRYQIVANEYGQLPTPGIARIDVRRGRCRTVWTSRERGASVVPKVSLPNGLLYTYTRPPTRDGSQAWYFTAIDVDTGRTVYKRLTGAGLLFNNHYAPISLGRGGVAYVGVLGGLLRLADTR